MSAVRYNFKIDPNTSMVLNLIRAIACQMVVIGHGISFFGILLWLHEPNFPWIQNIAVVIFFILSGILITHTTLERKKNPRYTFKNFFIDRFARIYSVYIPALLFVVVVDGLAIYYFGGKDLYDSYNARTFILNLFMLQNFPMLDYLSEHFSALSFLSYLSCTTFGSSRINWTLSMEWWFYMLIGWFALGKTMSKSKVLFYSLLVVLSLPPLCFALLGNKVGIAWFCGTLVILLLNVNMKLGSSELKLGLAVLFFVLSFARITMIHYAYDPFFYILLALFFYFLIDYSRSEKKVFFKGLKPVVDRLAAYSFTLFLIHYSIFNLLVLFTKDVSPYLLFLIGFMLSNLIAYTMAYFIEMRYKDLRHGMYKKLKIKEIH